MKNTMVYLVDENMYLFNEKNMYEENLTDIVVNGQIADKNKFMEQFNKILKKHKIKSRLFGDEITIVKNAFYSGSDLFFLEQLFLDLGFIKVNFFDIRELLPVDDATYIEINKDYIIFYLDIGIVFLFKYFKDLPKLFSLLDAFFKPTIILFGTNHNIPEIKYPNKRLYYFENYNNYLIDSLLKVKKCDA